MSGPRIFQYAHIIFPGTMIFYGAVIIIIGAFIMVLIAKSNSLNKICRAYQMKWTG